MEEKKELIIVKQLPIIEEHLKLLAEEIDKKVELATSLVVTNETVKEVKKVRAELNNEFKNLEAQRKQVKEAITRPYEDFELVYKECVSNKFKEADVTLKTKIEEVETIQKQKKEEEVRRYFIELVEREKIDFITYEQANINVTLSASMKSLKEQAKTFVDKIIDDLGMINSQEHADEIFIEYKKALNVSKAICEVTTRYKQLEQAKKQKEEKKRQELTDEEMLNKIESLSAPKEEIAEQQPEIFELVFKVRGTKEQLRKVKLFLEEGGYDFE